ncbi:MAG: M48 family metalloprotease [Firmicutes bacterium]|nr:M48 family metalloprotease [Bacillota bacterium]
MSLLLLITAALGLLPASVQARGPAAAAKPEVPPKARERVEAVFDRLVSALSREHPEVTEYTIDVVVEPVANAWINQDHQIYVTTGLIDLMETDDQLAGVIAHEIAHGVQGHIPNRVNQNVWSAVAVLALGAISTGQGDADWGGLLEMRDLFLYAFSREQESEADLVGMRFAGYAGYHREGLAEALERMDDQRRRLPLDSVWQQLYRTHPPIADRVSDLRMVLALEALDEAPLEAAGLVLGAAPGSPEEATQRFLRALWAGGEAAVKGLTVPGRAVDAGAPGLWSERRDPAWAAAELEVAERYRDGFDHVLVALLKRRGGPGSEEERTPPVVVRLRQTARGWFVSEWELLGQAGPSGG